MQVKPLISAIRMRNFLSFGEEVRELPLGTLNVLIGPNASGKSLGLHPDILSTVA